jgi:hypothetical protein
LWRMLGVYGVYKVYVLGIQVVKAAVCATLLRHCVTVLWQPAAMRKQLQADT